MVLELYQSAIIRDLNYRLIETNNSWIVNLTVYLEAGVGIADDRTVQGHLTVHIEDLATTTRYVTVQRTKNGEFAVYFLLEIQKVCYLVEKS